MQATTASGLLFGLTGFSAAQGEFELAGDREGWVGREPSEIQGETNPTLTLEAEQNYTLTWTNADGATHTFTIEDDEGNDVVGPTDQLTEEGDSQTVEFTATEEMTEYYCSVYPQSMRGSIEVAAGNETRDQNEVPDVRPISVRDVDDEVYELLYSYRKYRSLEVLLSDPVVNDVVRDMVSSFEAYDPQTNDVDAVSVQGSPGIEIEGGIDEGAFDVTAVDRQVAYGVVDRETDELVRLTVTEPRDVSWTAWQGNELEEARLRRVTGNPWVRERIEDNDWFPLLSSPAWQISARNIERGGVSTVVLLVDADDGLTALVVYLDVRENDVGEVIDTAEVARFVEFPPHELATAVEPANETVLEDVPSVPFELRPWYTANDGIHRFEKPEETFDDAGWTIEWMPPGQRGVEITASYQETPVFERLDAPLTYSAYGLPERDGESTLEWFFPDDEPVFAGDLLSWDVHSLDFGGPGALGTIEYPETASRPEGFRFRSHYHTGSTQVENQDVHSGYRFGTSSYEVSYDFWRDGVFMPVWKRQGPGFVTEYSRAGGAPGSDDDEVPRADPNDSVPHHHVACITMDVTPAGERPNVDVFDDNEWTRPAEEFYLAGEPGTIVRFTSPEGPETIDLPLDDDMEVVVVRRSTGEIPVRPLFEAARANVSFYHPAQYIGGEQIQGERVICWLLLEAATGQMPSPAGTTSFVARAAMQLSGY